MSLFRTPWICVRCARQLARPIVPRLIRFQSTAPSVGITSEAIYPALLERARAIAGEHTSLSQKLEEGYDATIAKRAGELGAVANALASWDQANDSLKELQSLLRDPNTDAELRELANQDLDDSVQQLNEASKSLTTSLVPKHPFADLPCLIEIRPGVGGKEAALFGSDLLRMYQQFCSQQGLRWSMVQHDTAADDPSQMIGAIMEVETSGAYGILRTEAGVHRIQRVPETETKGRTHTSTASVMVLPAFPESGSDTVDVTDPASDFYINPADIKRDYYRSSGAGGQHVNKTESAVRLTHLPTKIVVANQDGRSRMDNEKKAWALLRSRIAQQKREAREEEMISLRRSVIGVAKVGRSDKVRTYNFQQQRITDHRSGMTVLGIEGVLGGGGNLEKLMDSVRKWLAESEVEDMLAIANSDQAKKDKLGSK